MLIYTTSKLRFCAFILPRLGFTRYVMLRSHPVFIFLADVKTTIRDRKYSCEKPTCTGHFVNAPPTTLLIGKIFARKIFTFGQSFYCLAIGWSK